MRTGLLVTAALVGLASLTLANSASADGDVRDCSYVPRGGTDPVAVPACATISEEGRLHLRPGRLADMQFDEHGLAAVLVGPFAFYVARDGRSAGVAQVDQRAVAFHDGLAPSPQWRGEGYKIGYVDQRLRLVIPARYDGGLAFENGRAQVCNGCTVRRDGEMADLVGGTWGCIDTHGHEVVPVNRPTPDEAECWREGG